MSAAPGRPPIRSYRTPQGGSTPVSRAAYQINGQSADAAAFYALACDPTRSIAVEACAGAGKTWMLVARIVRALLDGTPAQNILAITFTKKAAGEMRERLAAELRRCAACTSAERVSTLVAWGLPPGQALAREGELLRLHDRLGALGRTVQVRTFHSWFAALLRGAPLTVLQALRLPLTHELLEDDERAMARVWPHFYAAVAADPECEQDFCDTVALHGRHQTLKALTELLRKRVEFTLADAAGVVETSVQDFRQAFADMGELNAPQDVLFQGAARTVLSEAARWLGAASAPTFSAKGGALETALSAEDFEGVRSALLTQKDEPRQFGKNLTGLETVREAQARVQQVLDARNQQAAWLHQQRMTRLGRVLVRAYARLKHERGWVDMNDLEGAAQRLLADAELSGWLQQRLDARVRHLLIDEFQDTNPLQWQAIYGWLSAYAGAGSGEAPRVFLVGDPKQSIYRFRRAEPQVFRAAQAFVVQGLGGAVLSCDHTRRCAPAVVQVLNAAMLDAVQAGEYANYRAHTTHSTEAGEVLALPQVLRQPRDTLTADADAPWRNSLSEPRVLPEDDGYSAIEARQAADWVAAQVDRGLAPGQIMVLARKRERLTWMHQALMERGIPSEQPEKKDLTGSPAVQDVIALLDALCSPQHNLSLARALKSPLFGWRDADLAHLALVVRMAESTATWSQVLPTLNEEPFLSSSERLSLYRGWLHSLPPHDALSAIYEHGQVLTRYASAVPDSQRAQVLATLRDLLAQSLAHEGGRFLSAYRWVRALKAGGLQATPTHQPTAVQLLTIHAAKGLEAHTVLLLDTDGGPPKGDSMGVLVDWPGMAPAPQRLVFLASEKAPPVCCAGLLQAEQAARALEELNALYVALTRAEVRLVLSSFEPHQRGSHTTWWTRLREWAMPEAAPLPHLARGGLPGASLERATLPALTRAPRAAPLAPPESGPDDERRRIGLALHRLLEWRPTPASGFDWSDEHQQAVARAFGLIPVQAAQALAMARQMVNGKGSWAWDAQWLDFWGNEVDILYQGRALRLDRLVRERASGTWWVLDFKSEAHPQHRPELLEQLRTYGQALGQSQPGATVRLAFINPLGEVIEIDAGPTP
jgi:ATP-dependent helicase/nuclease subunit A